MASIRHLPTTALLVAVFAMAVTARADDAELKTYDLKESGFQVQVPAAWSPRKLTGHIVMLLTVDMPEVKQVVQPTFMAIVNDSSAKPGDDLMAAVRAAQGVITKNSPEAKFGEPTKLTIAGERAICYDYTRQIQGHDARGIQFWMLHKKKLYFVSFFGDPVTYDAKLATIEKVITSWKWAD